MSSDGPLAGIVVVENGSREAVAICGSLLAQLGATVIVVESDNPARRSGRAQRAQFMAGKLSLVPGWSSRDAILFEKLQARADIILTSSDIDVDAVSGPGGAIHADITAFGTTGPLAGVPYSDLQVQALSGITDTTGFPERAPVPIGVPIVSYLTGTYAASAVLAALRVKRLQGVGQAIEIAMFDCAFVTLNAFLSSVLTSETAVKSRLGNRHPTVAPWNVYPTSDGLVLICAGNQGQWERLCGAMGRPDVAETYHTQGSRIEFTNEVDAEIGAWTQTLTTAACVDILADLAVAAGPIAPIEQYPREANIDYRDMIVTLFDPEGARDVYLPRSPLRMGAKPGLAPARIPERDGDREEIGRIVAQGATSAKGAASSSSALDRPLVGVRIIEIGQYTTAPLCARHLAHLGAEVIKIEQPGGDESRTWVPHVAGKSVSFRLNNSDKRTIILDLRSSEGAAILQDLLSTADVLVENTKPGTLAKFGLSPDRIQALNPKLIHCAISGFGENSLYAKRPAFDMVIQAMSGFMVALRPGEDPLKSGISTADTMGAEMAMVAILAGLEHKERTGRGQYIDLSMQDISCWLTQTVWNTDLDAIARPTMVACADGYVTVEETEERVRELMDAQSPQPLQTLSRDEVAAWFVERGVGAAPVQTVREASVHPQTSARRLWYRMAEGEFEWPMLASPLRLQLTPPRVTHLAPDADVDRAAILKELECARQEGGRPLATRT